MLDFITFHQESASMWKEYVAFLGNLIVILVGAWVTINKYYQERKTMRLEDAYYKSSIIKPLEELGKLYAIINKNSTLLACLNNYLSEKRKVVEANQVDEIEKTKLFRKLTCSGYINKIVNEIQLLEVNLFYSDLEKNI